MPRSCTLRNILRPASVMYAASSRPASVPCGSWPSQRPLLGSLGTIQKETPARNSRTGVSVGGGGGTVGSISFDMAWTMPSSRFFPGCGASYPLTARILVPAPSLPTQRVYESLQGKAGWPCLTPRRCHAVRYSGRRQGSPNEPRFHPALTSRGDHCVNRTRVRKPSANQFYMRSLSMI